jgi:hypothetical protein
MQDQSLAAWQLLGVYDATGYFKSVDQHQTLSDKYLSKIGLSTRQQNNEPDPSVRI